MWNKVKPHAIAIACVVIGVVIALALTTEKKQDGTRALKANLVPGKKA